MTNVDGKHCPEWSDCCPASVGPLSAINRIHCPHSSECAGQSAPVGASKPESTQRPEPERKLTREEFRQEELQNRAKRLQQAAQQPNAPRSLERPAHVREADDKKSAGQEAAKDPAHKPTQQPETARKLTKEEFLQEERGNRAERLHKAAQRAASEVTQQGAQQQRGPNLGGGISR
jgi:hypothetical protein